MKKVMRCFAMISTLASSAAYGGQHDNWEDVYFNEHIEGVYSQDWFAKHLLRTTQRNTHEIYVKGDGKTGGFNGVLYLDCVQPKYSRWLALPEDEYALRTTDVPANFIAMIRKKIC